MLLIVPPSLASGLLGALLLLQTREHVFAALLRNFAALCVVVIGIAMALSLFLARWR